MGRRLPIRFRESGLPLTVSVTFLFVRTPEALPQDEELVAGLRAGDRATYAQLLDAWSTSMLRIARTFVSTTASAEEVVQDTWLAIIRGVDRFEGRSALKTWVYQILVNTARKRGVREQRTVPVSFLPTSDDGGPTVDPARFQDTDDRYPGGWRAFPASWPNPESALLAGEITRVINDALEELPARQRVVLSLRDVDGHDSAEVCALLSITPENQRVLLHRARAAVRARLAAYFTPEPTLAGGA
jgi:RNA polymerase sigma-70 factor (ECF subfamily)